MERILRQFGYRPMQDGVWGKPFAYQILIARLIKGKWTLSNHFKGNDKLHVWASKPFANLDDLKFAEAEIIHVVMNGQYGDFEFETAEDLFSSIL